jgi:putative inorganic carbon (hco3(-)) transporter
VRAVPLVAVGTLLVSTGLEILPADDLGAKITVARVLIILGLLALLATGARPRDLATRFDLYVGIVLLPGLLATIAGGSGAPLRFLLTAIAFYYLTVGVLRRAGDAGMALAVVALVAVAAAGGVGLSQTVQDTCTGFYREGLSPITVDEARPDLEPLAVGTFANPNLLAAYVLLLAPIGVVAALAAQGRGVRTVMLGAVALAYAGLLATFSRAALVAALAAGGWRSSCILAWSAPRGRGWPSGPRVWRACWS